MLSNDSLNALKDAIQFKKAELKKVNEEINALQTKLDSRKVDRDAIKSAKEAMEADVAAGLV